MSDRDQPATTRPPRRLRISWPMLVILYILGPTVVPWLVFMYLASR